MQKMRVGLVVLLLLGCVSAQGGEPVGKGSDGAKVVAKEASSKRVMPKYDAPKLSPEFRVELAATRKVAREVRGKTGPQRSRQLELTASSFDRLVAKFEAEPAAAALAAWSAAEAWRRHGSAPLAEKDYLHAAKCDPVRYGQRGLLGAADMQRRQQRVEDAVKTYEKAEAVDPRTSRAQQARLWVARILLKSKKVDVAIEKFQAALESAPSPRQAIDAANFLAKAWIQKGDLDSAGFVIEHAEKLVADSQHDDPIVAERLRRACDRMSARRALQRARDAKHGAAKDAVRLDEHRRKRAQAGGVDGGGGTSKE